MQQGEQQEQDARDEDRAAGQENTQKGERCASEQEDGPPAGPHGVRGPRHRSGAGGCLRAGVCGRVTDVQEHPGPFIRPGSHQAPPGNVLVPCLQDNRPTRTGQEQMSPAPGPNAPQVRGWPGQQPHRQQAVTSAWDDEPVRIRLPRACVKSFTGIARIRVCGLIRSGGPAVDLLDGTENSAWRGGSTGSPGARGRSGAGSRRAAVRPARARRPGWWSCRSRSARWKRIRCRLELAAHDIGESTLVGFDDGAGVMGGQPARHGVGVLGVAQVPDAVECVQACGDQAGCVADIVQPGGGF
jgi:hypothetical protein